MQFSFDPDRLELTISSQQALPKVIIYNGNDCDMLGHATGQTRVPGPLADPGAKQVWSVDPRAASGREKATEK
jgi:hypothetical protein